MQILKVILLLGLSLKGVFLEDKVSGESHAMDYHDPAEIVKTEDYKSRKEGYLADCAADVVQRRFNVADFVKT